MQKSGRLKNIIDPALILNFLPISDNDDYGDDKDLPVLLAHSVIDDDKDDDKDDENDHDNDNGSGGEQCYGAGQRGCDGLLKSQVKICLLHHHQNLFDHPRFSSA